MDHTAPVGAIEMSSKPVKKATLCILMLKLESLEKNGFDYDCSDKIHLPPPPSLTLSPDNDFLWHFCTLSVLELHRL